MDFVKIEIAFRWKCLRCGSVNFSCSHDFPFDADDRPQLEEEIGLQPYEPLPEGEFVCAPSVVECPACCARFATEEPGEMEGD